MRAPLSTSPSPPTGTKVGVGLEKQQHHQQSRLWRELRPSADLLSTEQRTTEALRPQRGGGGKKNHCPSEALNRAEVLPEAGVLKLHQGLTLWGVQSPPDRLHHRQCPGRPAEGVMSKAAAEPGMAKGCSTELSYFK